MKILISFFLYFFLLVQAIAQPTFFSFVDSEISASFHGNATIDDIAAEEGDWIAAFDSDGVCVGANPIVFTGGLAYFTLVIMGDDVNTSIIDEGMQENELFTIKIWDNSISNVITFPDENNPTMFDGWSDLNGNPIVGLDDGDINYNFTNLFNLSCTNLISPSDGTQGVALAKFINWHDVPEATGYKVSIGTSSNNYNFLDQYDVGLQSNIFIDSFQCGNTYFVKIITYNIDGEQNFCQEEQFSTIFNDAYAGEDVSICSNSSTQLSASGGTIFQWTPSIGLSDTTTRNPIASPLVTTTYKVNVIHPNGCSDVESVTITVLPNPTSNLTINHETSQGADNGSAFSSPTGGEAPYSLLWSTGATNSSISNLSPGNYSLTVTGNNQCTDITDFEIIGFNCDPFEVSVTLKDVSCHDDCDGRIVVDSVQYGVEPYSFLWSNGEIKDSIYNLCPGLFTVTIEDAEGCTAIKSYEVGNPGILDANINSVKETSSGAMDGIAFCNPLGGTTPFVYKWSNGESGSIIDSLSQGHYLVTITDAGGCIDSALTTINQVGCENFMAITSVEPNTCFGLNDASITINLIKGGVEPYSINWNTGSDEEILTDLSPGRYLLTVTDAVGCNTFNEIYVEDVQQLQANLDITNETIENANNGMATSIPSGGQGPYIYRWSNNMFTPTIQNLTPGDYQLSLSDANNCTVIDSFTIEPYVCPIFDIQKEFQNIVCNGNCDGSIGYDVSGGTFPYNYNWNTGQIFNSLNNLCSGTYIVTITDVNGCYAIDTTVVDEPSILELDLDINHESGNLTHDGSITAIPQGGVAPYFYQWNIDESNSSIFNLIPGTYSLTMTDSRGCEIIKNEIVINGFECAGLEIEYFVEDVNCFGVCDGNIIITSISEGTFPFTYSWSSGETNNNIMNKCKDNYSLTITDANNCVLEQSFTINEPDPYVIIFESMDAHKNQNDGYIHATIEGGTPPYTQVWNTGQNTLNLDNISGGSYMLSVTDAKGCKLSKSIDILSIDCELLTVDSDHKSNSCFDSFDSYITINIQGGITPYDIKWSNGVVGETSLSPVIAGDYKVTVTDGFNCEKELSFIITTPEKLVLSLEKLVHITDTSHMGEIGVSVDGGIEPYSFNWTSSNGFQSDLSSIGNLQVDCYNLQLTDANDCAIEFDGCIADLRTGVKDHSALSNNFHIYPNPSDGKLYLSIKEKNYLNISADVYSLAGEKLMSLDRITPEVEFNISSLNDGLYFIQLRADDDIIYKKIYIKK